MIERILESLTCMRNACTLRMRPGFAAPGTVAMIALLAVGAVGLATTSRAIEAVVATDAKTEAATAVTVVSLAALSEEEKPPTPPSVPVEPAAAPPDGASAEPATPKHDDAAVDEDRPEPPPDPQECRDVRRQVRDQFRELNRFEKMLRKLKLDADLQTLVALRAKIKGFDNAIAKECTRERLQEFYDEQVGEQVNEFRCKAELPQQFAQIERELKRLERSATAKKLAAARLDPERFKANLEEVKQAIAAAKSGVAAGSCEDANDAMQTIYEGKHPGEINGVVQRLSEIGNQLKRVKDAAVRDEFAAVLQPIIDAANEGDFREANQAINEVFNELQQLLYKVISSRRFQYSPRLERLEGLLGEKFGKEAPEAEPVQ